MKVRFPRFSKTLFLAWLLLAVPTLLCSCSAPDAENQAYRPWGGADGWHGSLPTGLTEGR